MERFEKSKCHPKLAEALSNLEAILDNLVALEPSLRCGELTFDGLPTNNWPIGSAQIYVYFDDHLVLIKSHIDKPAEFVFHSRNISEDAVAEVIGVLKKYKKQ